MTLPETLCARCGVVILVAAPVVAAVGYSEPFPQPFHPGCWAAEQRQTTTTTGAA